MIELKYKKLDNSIKTIVDMEARVIVNALASHKRVSKAAKTLKVTDAHLWNFIKSNNIKTENLKSMREDYKLKLLGYGNSNENINT